MKKSLSILLLLAFGISIIGFFPLFKILQYQTRREIKLQIKQGIPENELHKIVFAANEKPEWVREGKEFRYKNQMYDIVRKEKSNGSTIYYCVNDTEETQLFANLDVIVKKQMDDENSPIGNSIKVLMKIFSQVYLAENPQVFNQTGVECENHFEYQIALTSIHSETETPPPDLG